MKNKPKKKPVHYVNNADLLIALTKYTTEYNLAKKNKLPTPKVPEYVGECILLIATKLSNSPNFYSYSYKEDMVADGIENCLSYLHNFNPEKSKNAFAYLTQICWYAAIRRIAKEKKQKQIKSEMIKNSGILNMDFDSHFGDDKEYKSNFLDFLQSNLESDSKNNDVDEKHGVKKSIKKTTKRYQETLRDEKEKLRLLEQSFSEDISQKEHFDIDIVENLEYNTNSDLDEFFSQ